MGLLAACSAERLQAGVYKSDGLAFRVGPVPESWRPIEVDEALLAFRDDSSLATIAVNGRCGKDGDDVPLEALTHHLFLQFTDRKVISQRKLPLDEREALRTEIIAKLDGVAKHYTVYVLKKDGCVYDFLHIGAIGASDNSRSDFESFVHGFSTLSSPGSP